MRIVVTGNGGGIGAAIQQALEAEHTILGTHRTGGILPGQPRRIYDVTSQEDIGELVRGGVDVLINNAGMLDTEPFGELTMEGMRKVLDVNLIAPLLLAQAAVARGCKLVVNIGSSYGVTGSYGAKPTYAASKAALHSATVSLARCLAGRCRAVAIAPGIIDTGIHDGKGGIQKHGRGHALVGRLGTAGEVAEAVRFVIANEYVNGTILEVTGGR